MELPNLLKSEPSTDAIELLKEDHREVEGLFKEFEDTDDKVEKVALASVICHALAVHAEIEEQLFYPESRLVLDDDQEDMVDEARSEEQTSELQSLMRISYAVFCLTKKKTKRQQRRKQQTQET